MTKSETDAQSALGLAEAALQRRDYEAARCAANDVAQDPASPGLDRARAWGIVGTSNWRLGNLRGAIFPYQRRIGEYEDAGYTTSVFLADAISDLGIAYLFLERHEDALALQMRALAVAEPHIAENSSLVRAIRRRIAQVHHDMGRDSDAARYYLDSKPDPGDGAAEEISWNNSYAIFLEDRGDIHGALRHAREIARISETSPDAIGVVPALCNVLQFLVELEEWDEVAATLWRIRTIAHGDKATATRVGLLEIRSLALDARGRSIGAANVYRKIVDLLEREAHGSRGGVERYGTLADLLARAGREGEARDILRRILPDGAPINAENLGIAIRRARILLSDGHPGKARDLLALALTADLGFERPVQRWQILLALSDSAAAAALPQASIVFGKMAIEQIHHAARRSISRGLGKWVKSRLSAFDTVLDQLAVSGRFLEACHLQLRRMDEISHDLGAFRSQGTAPSAEMPYRKEEAALRRIYVDLDARARHVHQGQGEPPGTSGSEISSWVETVWQSSGTGKSADRPDKSPQPGASATPTLTFLATGDRLTGYLRTDGQEHTFDIFEDAKTLAGHARRFRSACADGAGQDSLLAWSQHLYDVLLRPAVDALGDHRHLDLILWGFLSFIPFSALHDGERFVCERLSLARRTGRRGGAVTYGSGMTRLAAFASDGGRYESIPEALTEARSVSAHSGGDPVFGTDFTADALRQALSEKPDIVHIASHFRYRADRPQLSALLLGDGSELTLEDLSQPEFDFSGVGLLVLSCCSTGISDDMEFGFEGFAGLAQSKGAGHVVGSLWEVDDLATRAFMDVFYRDLARGVSPATALATAQKEMVRATARPRVTAAPRGGIGGTRRSRGWRVADWSAFCVYSPAVSGPREAFRQSVKSI